MLIDWLRLVAALVLLWVPITLFHGSQVVYREVTREWEGYWGRTFGLSLHTLDFIRAMLGAWLIATAITRDPAAQGAMKYAAFATQTAIFALATTLQALVCKEPDAAHAPFAFVSGLVLGVVPPHVAGFALLVAAMTAFGTRAAGGYFPVLALALCGIGPLFTGKKHLYALLSVAIPTGLPWLLILLFPRHFVSSCRAKRPDIAPSPR